MSTDFIFVLGVALGILAVPAIVSAYVDERPPRGPAVIVLISALMVGYAMIDRPGAYSWSTLPDVLVRTIAALTR